MRMPGRTRFRFVLPIAQTVAAVALGSFGLWQRHSILNRPGWGDRQTLWDTTARFHVWPWPFKFAVASNIPAFLTSSLVTLPVKQISEWTGLMLVVLFVPLLWYGVGRRLDSAGEPAKAWVFVLVFTVASVACASVPLAYIGYIYSGTLMWMATGFVLLTVFRGSRVSVNR